MRSGIVQVFCGLMSDDNTTLERHVRWHHTVPYEHKEGTFKLLLRDKVRAVPCVNAIWSGAWRKSESDRIGTFVTQWKLTRLENRLVR